MHTLLADTLDGTSSGASASSPVAFLIIIGVMAAAFAGMWKMFTKAGQPGWAILVPIYNIVLMCRIAGKSGWFTLLFFVPVANVVALFMVAAGISRNFGKGTGTTLGLVFLSPIFYAILGFGSATYRPVGYAPPYPAMA